MENQAIVNAIAERLGALRERPCLDIVLGDAMGSVIMQGGIHTELGYRPLLDSKHTLCRGTGFITEPRYQAAWELLIDPASPTTPQHCWWVVGWPACAVVGLLEGVVRAIHDPKLYAFLVNWKHDPNYGSVAMLSDLYMRGVTPFRWPDPDDAQGLGKALLEALK